MKQILQISLLLSWLGSATLLAQSPIDRYIDTAMTHHPALKSLRLMHEADRTQAAQVSSLPDPVVGVNVFALPVETRLGPQRAGISVSQSFPWFGSLEAAEKLSEAKAGISARRLSVEQARILLNVRQQYARLYELEARIRLTSQHILRLQSLESLSTVKVEAGKANLSDVLQIQMEINELEEQEESLKAKRIPMTQQFAEMLGLDGLEHVELPDSLPEKQVIPSEDSLRTQMLRHHPSLAELEARQAMFQQAESVVAFQRKPGFTAGIGYVSVGQRTDADVPGNGRDIVQASAGIRIPLAQRKYEAQAQEARLRGEAIDQQRTRQVQQLQTELRQALNAFDDAERKMALYREQAGLARQSLDIMIQAYAVEARKFEDLLNMERQILRYELAREEALVAREISIARLSYLSGN